MQLESQHHNELSLFQTVSGAGPLHVNLDVLISSRLLIQANSGGGKSWFIRYLLEQTYGHVQQIVLDPEGEFATLREKFDYLLAGQDGDVPAVVSTARPFCRQVVELGVSTVIDLYDLELDERRRYVAEFLDEMINLPRELWKPLLVIIDEAHFFAPQGTFVESSAALKALVSLGRKRGFCGVLATQRLSKLDKDVAAELGNKAIGRTGLDVDVRRASDELGFDTKAKATLKHLPPGSFYVYGPALCEEVTLIRSGAVVTSHPEPGTVAPPPPPAPETLRALVEQIQEMVKADKDDEAARVERAVEDLTRVQELEKEIERLDALLAEGSLSEAERKELEILRLRDRDAEFIIAHTQQKHVAFTSRLGLIYQEMQLDAQKYQVGLQAAMAQDRACSENVTDYDRTPVQGYGESAPQEPTVESTVSSELVQRILDVLATYEKFGHKHADRAAVAVAAGFREGGHFNNGCTEALAAGFIMYPFKRMLALTETGRGLAKGEVFENLQELHERWLANCTADQRRILQELLEAYPHELFGTVLAARTKVKGAPLNKAVMALERARAVVNDDNRFKVHPLLFPEGVPKGRKKNNGH